MNHASLQWLAAAEREQLVGEGAAAFGGAANLLQRRALVLLQIAAAQQQIAVTGDDRKQIVEIVRNTAGEPADRLHLLRLAELLLEPIALAPEACGAEFAFHGSVQPHQIAARKVIG